MSAFVLEFPESLRTVVAVAASRRGVSESAWLEEAAREKLAAETEMAYLMARAARSDRAAYEGVLNRVPASTPAPGDERNRVDAEPGTPPDSDR